MTRLKTSSMTPVIAVCVSDSFGHELPVRIDDRPNQIVPTFEITPAGIRSYFQPTMAAPYSSTLNFGFNAGAPLVQAWPPTQFARPCKFPRAGSRHD